MTLRVPLCVMPHGEGLPLPDYQSAGAAGIDLLAAIGENSKLILEPGARELVPTGISIQLPLDHEAQVRPRSGLAFKNGVTVLNSPGTIDSDFRGEIRVILINLGTVPFEILRGTRIAQLVVASVTRVKFSQVSDLSSTERGEGGFGSTGLVVTSERQS